MSSLAEEVQEAILRSPHPTPVLASGLRDYDRFWQDQIPEVRRKLRPVTSAQQARGFKPDVVVALPGFPSAAANIVAHQQPDKTSWVYPRPL